MDEASNAVWFGCANGGTINATIPIDQCSSSTVLTDDDFTYGGTDYTIARITVGGLNSQGGNRLRLAFDSLTRPAAKTALSSLTLTVGTGADAKSFAISTLTTGTEHSDAVLQSGTTHGLSWSSGDSVALKLTAATATVPAKPTGLAATAGNARVALSWTDPSDSSITKYQYKQKTGNAAWPTSWTDISGSGATTTSHTVTSLNNGTAYRFRIRAVNAQGNSPQSDATTAVTPSASAVLSPPSNALWSATLTVDRDAQGIDYGCDNTEANLDNCSTSTVLTDDDFTYGGTTYTVAFVAWDSEDDDLGIGFAGVQGAAAKTALKSLALSVDGTALAVGNAQGANGGLFWPYDPSPDWTDGKQVSLWLTAVVKPAKPTGLTATRGDREVALAWTDPGDASITGWQVQRKAGSAAWGSWTAIPDSTATTASHTVIGLTNGTAYRFRIRAVNGAGDGAASEAGR